MTRVGTWIFVCLSIAVAQTPPQQTQASGLIEGRVINSKTGEPMRKASVTLSAMFSTGGQRPDTNQASTDSDGKFRFDLLAAGRYRILVYATRSLGSPATKSIELGAGQELTSLSFKLPPPAVVTGKVVDEDGDPVPYVQVQAIAVTNSKTQQRFGGSSGSTDDTGTYRIFGLKAGRYRIVATSQNRMMGAPAAARKPGAKPVETYQPTFHPSEKDAATARVIELIAGQESSGIDVRLQKSRAFHVRGRIIPPDPSDAAKSDYHFTASVRSRSPNSVVDRGPMMGINSKDLKFEIADVRPGSYYVVIQEMAVGKIAARMKVDVTEEDVENLVIPISKGVTITGKVAVEGEFDKSQFAGKSFTLMSIDPMMGQRVTQIQLKADGTFTAEDVRPGRYEFMINSIGDAWPKSLHLDGEETGFEFDFEAAAPGEMILSFGTGVGTIDGVAQDSGGQPAAHAYVALVPSGLDPKRYQKVIWHSADAQGQFKFDKVAPGGYRVFTWTDDHDPTGVLDVEMFKPVESQGQRVDVAKDDQKHLTATIISMEEVFK